jgi:quercetin dioxygenase-like cupin family protein
MPVVEVDVHATLNEIQRELKSGHTARTLVKHGSLRIVLVVLKAGATVPEHQTEGRVSIHAIGGRVRVHAGGTAFELPAGRLLALDPGERHDVKALEDSAVLLTIAMPSPQ